MVRVAKIWSWLIAVSAGGLPTVAAACPACKDAIAGDPVATALSATTLVLIAIPFSLIAAISCWVAYTLRHANRSEIEIADGSTASPFYPVLREKESES